MKHKLIILSLIAGALYLFSFSYPEPVTLGVDDEWVVPANFKKMKNPEPSNKESLSIGKELYNKHCRSCHGSSGKGDGPKAMELETPSGDFSIDDFQKQSDGELFYKTKEGRDEMPSFKKKISSDEDIWHIVNFVRTLKK
jgi:mono/diheme cytochrome c family protein